MDAIELPQEVTSSPQQEFYNQDPCAVSELAIPEQSIPPFAAPQEAIDAPTMPSAADSEFQTQPQTSGPQPQPSEQSGEPQPQTSQQTDRPLTSRFRGVCWNKKNRRWQAAINSSGKYIYLGSFISEDEAARAFDRAAIRLRGHRAKLNFQYADYVDEAGNLIEDPRLPTFLAKVEQLRQGTEGLIAVDEHGRPIPGFPLGASPQQLLLRAGFLGVGKQEAMCIPGQRFSGAAQYKPGSLSLFGNEDWQTRSLQPKLTTAGGQVSASTEQELDNRFNYTFNSRGIQQVTTSVTNGLAGAPFPAHKGSDVLRPGKQDTPTVDLRLPPGCQVNSIIPGEEDTLGVVYHSTTDQVVGSAIWDGNTSHDMGAYESEKDAQQACSACMKVVVHYKRAFAAASFARGPFPSTASTDRYAAPAAAAQATGISGPMRPGLDNRALLPEQAMAGVSWPKILGESAADAARPPLAIDVNEPPEGTDAQGNKPSYAELFQFLHACQGKVPGPEDSSDMIRKSADDLISQNSQSLNMPVAPLKRPLETTDMCEESKRQCVNAEFANVQKLSNVRLQDAIQLAKEAHLRGAADTRVQT